MASPSILHIQQARHLEYYLQSQEAARSFDDDLDFCPNLTAKEFSERMLELSSARSGAQAKWQQQNHPDSYSTTVVPSPPAAHHATRAIAIIDPASRAPVQVPFRQPSSPQAAPPSLLPLTSARPFRQGSISSVSSSSSESYAASDMSTADSFYLDVQDALLLDQSVQHHEMLQMYQLQQQQQQQQQQQYLQDATMFRPFWRQDMFLTENMYPSAASDRQLHYPHHQRFVSVR
ncbi:hypothetical protein BGZ98_003698 [Dissophora globulifera]|nr:hypothetical protein BGZ98_003698 [Dissophora globulifera]